MTATSQIRCSACGEDALLKRVPKYDGFKKVGEALIAGEEISSVAVAPTLRATTVVPPAIDRRTHPPLAS